MADFAKCLNQIHPALDLSPAAVRQLAGQFHDAMALGLDGRPSPLKMLPSYIAKPTGDERGGYLGLDFGGSNVRVQLVDLLGHGRWAIRQKRSVPLRDSQEHYDYTTAETEATALFDFLAEQIAEVVDARSEYLLGHTFSFPCDQQDLNQATLISWTKEIKTAGVEGHEINELLSVALVRRGLSRVTPCAIINDTVGTLLTAAYSDQQTDIGAICGTGHNACYYEPGKAMIINLESGNFDLLPYTEFDDRLDAASEKPGTQRLEKMVAGRYLGELVRLIAAEFVPVFLSPGILTTKDLSEITAGAVPARLEAAQLSASEYHFLQAVTNLAVARSAKLVAATFLGILLRIDPQMRTEHTLALDGSLYEKMPGYALILAATLSEALGDKAKLISVKLSKDGSGVGAAIAAAVAKRSR